LDFPPQASSLLPEHKEEEEEGRRREGGPGDGSLNLPPSLPLAAFLRSSGLLR